LTNSGRVKTRVRFAEQDAGKQSNHRTIDQMTDDTDNMNALSADRKPVVLISGQYEITVEIDNDGDVILRQEQQYGDHPDTIVIARANLSAFISDLIECALPELCFPLRCDASVRAEADTNAVEPMTARQSSDPTAAERQRRHRLRKRNQTNGVSSEPTMRGGLAE
jgi:hypothetical protein